MNDAEIIIEMLKGKNDSQLQSLFLAIEKKLNVADSKHQLILDIDSFFISNSFKKIFIDFLERNLEKKISIALCGVGRGVRKVIIQSIDYPLYIADDREDAVDWLKG